MTQALLIPRKLCPLPSIPSSLGPLAVCPSVESDAKHRSASQLLFPTSLPFRSRFIPDWALNSSSSPSLIIVWQTPSPGNRVPSSGYLFSRGSDGFLLWVSRPPAWPQGVGLPCYLTALACRARCVQYNTSYELLQVFPAESWVFLYKKDPVARGGVLRHPQPENDQPARLQPASG